MKAAIDKAIGTLLIKVAGAATGIEAMQYAQAVLSLTQAINNVR